jgi:RHS repeat-associated protein
VALVNAATGAIAAQYEYGPFGELIRATGPMAFINPFLFSTKYYDWETGLYYYGYRYYNPSTGRWPSRDPEQEQGGENLYVIVSNDPVGDVDFLGLVDAKFEVCVGNSWALGSLAGVIGDWGQPQFCANGSYTITDKSASSTVIVLSYDPLPAPLPGNGTGSCNTVNGASGNSGTIELFVRSPNCPGRYNITITAIAGLNGTGPLGYASAMLILADGKVAWSGAGGPGLNNYGNGALNRQFVIPNVILRDQWVKVATYTPTIDLTPDHGKKSSGIAHGEIHFDGAAVPGQ